MKSLCSSVFCPFLLPFQIYGIKIPFNSTITIEFYFKCCQEQFQVESYRFLRLTPGNEKAKPVNNVQYIVSF